METLRNLRKLPPELKKEDLVSNCLGQNSSSAAYYLHGQLMPQFSQR